MRLLSEGMHWITSKDCHGLVEMEKGKLKRELIEEFVSNLKTFLRSNDPGMNKGVRERFRKLIERWEGKL